MAGEGSAPGAAELEQVVRRVWAELGSGVAITGDTDVFDDLGATSLQAITITERVEDALDVVVTLQALFDAPRFGDYVQVVAAAVNRAVGTTEGSA